MPPQACTGRCMQIRQRALLVDELEKVSLRVGFRGVWSGAGLGEQRALTCSPGPAQLGAVSTCRAPGGGHTASCTSQETEVSTCKPWGSEVPLESP